MDPIHGTNLILSGREEFDKDKVGFSYQHGSGDHPGGTAKTGKVGWRKRRERKLWGHKNPFTCPITQGWSLIRLPMPGTDYLWFLIRFPRVLEKAKEWKDGIRR